MAKIDFKARISKLLGGVFIVFLICSLAYAGYLFYVFKSLPGMKAKVAGLYNLFAEGQVSAPVLNNPVQAANGGWTTINTKTNDETIERLSSMSEKEVRQKLNEVKDYEKLIDRNSLKLLKKMVELVSKNKDTAVIPGEDEKQIKAMLETIIDDCKHNRIPGI